MDKLFLPLDTEGTGLRFSGYLETGREVACFDVVGTAPAIRFLSAFGVPPEELALTDSEREVLVKSDFEKTISSDGARFVRSDGTPLAQSNRLTAEDVIVVPATLLERIFPLCAIAH